MPFTHSRARTPPANKRESHLSFMVAASDDVIANRAEILMEQVVAERRQTFAALAAPGVEARLKHFASDLTLMLLRREDKATTLTHTLLHDLADNAVPTDALTAINDAFCKKLAVLLSETADATSGVRLIRQVTHAQISVRMVIINAHLQNLLAQRHHQ